jgi:hypothetical protein
MFVARYTAFPRYDEARNWSGYQEPTAKSAEVLADMLIDYGHVKLPQRLANAYWNGDSDEAIQWVLDNYDIRYHEAAGVWCLCHHEGLSCWRLNASTVEEAVEEARQMDADCLIQWGNFGDRTVGQVRYVASVSETLHIFECDDVERETE